MTREKALEVSNLIFKIERYEAFLDELDNSDGLYELAEVFGDKALGVEIKAIVQSRLDSLLKELEEM